MAASLLHASLHWERDSWARVRAGDHEAFAQLYRAFAPALYRQVLLPKLSDPQAAEDALAETFRVLLEEVETVDCDERSLWPWLCRVATNKALDQYRKSIRARRALVNFEQLLVPPAGGDPGPEDPDRALDQERLAQRIARLLEGLSPRYQQALELRFLQDLSREECARRMDVKLGTFDVLVLRALRALRREWDVHFSRSERGER